MSVVGLLVACSEKLLSLLMFPLFDFSFLSIPVVYSLLPKPAIFPCALIKHGPKHPRAPMALNLSWKKGPSSKLAGAIVRE